MDFKLDRRIRNAHMLHSMVIRTCRRRPNDPLTYIYCGLYCKSLPYVSLLVIRC
jgi:hypothetical protein